MAAEALIIERLKERVPGFRAVMGEGELSAIEERKQVTPSAYVVLDRYRPLQQRDYAVEWEQTWIVAVAVRNAKAKADAMREDAGPLISAVLQALTAWQPSKDHTRLTIGTNPRPVIEADYAYFPLTFNTRVMVRGTGD